MKKTSDSKIQARVRILLARRWVDLRCVTIGTTNGVVYIGGSLRISGGVNAWDSAGRVGDTAGRVGDSPGNDGDSSADSRWMSRIRREISEIPEVRDVVFQLEGRIPAGGTWPQEAA